MNQQQLINLATKHGLIILTEDFPKTNPNHQRLLSKLEKFYEAIQGDTPTDEQIMQLWSTIPAQGDPTGKAFALKFGRGVLNNFRAFPN